MFVAELRSAKCSRATRGTKTRRPTLTVASCLLAMRLSTVRRLRLSASAASRFEYKTV